jgi:hypothetical protein
MAVLGLLLFFALGARTALLLQLESQRLGGRSGRGEGGGDNGKPQVLEDLAHDLGIGQESQHYHGNGLSGRAARTGQCVHRQDPA